jgi:uncharacterized DUF497 family protein
VRIEFDWDDEKAASNLRKHGIAFERAAEVFRDPLHDTVDDEFAVGERRFRTTGLVRGIGLLMVIHTVENRGQDDELIRIISARLAERHERKAYEDG